MCAIPLNALAERPSTAMSRSLAILQSLTDSPSDRTKGRMAKHFVVPRTVMSWIEPTRQSSRSLGKLHYLPDGGSKANGRNCARSVSGIGMLRKLPRSNSQHTDVDFPRATTRSPCEIVVANSMLLLPSLAICNWMANTSSNLAEEAYSHSTRTRGQLIEGLNSSCIITEVPRLRKNACSACSMYKRNAEKWTIPAASVSQNSTRRWWRNISAMMLIPKKKPLDFQRLREVSHLVASALICTATEGLFGNVRQKSHKSSSLDCASNRVLANRRATGFATTDNAAMAVDKLG